MKLRYMRCNINMEVTEFRIGQSGTFSKTLTQTDVYSYAGISGDFNPVHVNEMEAKNSLFGKQVVHGMLTASLISTVIGTVMPGKGSIYLGQNLKFLKPVFFGDTITAVVTVLEIDVERSVLKLQTQEFNQYNDMVVDGTAMVKI